MSLEIYWKKALEQTRLSIDDESLYPLKTDIITRDLYEKDDFIIRKLDTSKFIKKKISLLVSNSLIHHITNLEDFFNTIRGLSSNITVNFHKDLKRPLDEKSALELKAQCSKKYNEILTNDYYASLRASYTFKELKNFTLENDLSSLDVFEEGDNYLIVYGNV